jgi:hypothetical protein
MNEVDREDGGLKGNKCTPQVNLTQSETYSGSKKHDKHTRTDMKVGGTNCSMMNTSAFYFPCLSPPTERS